MEDIKIERKAIYMNFKIIIEEKDKLIETLQKKPDHEVVPQHINSVQNITFDKKS